MECSIINPALSHLMEHLVIGQHQTTPILSAFHWSPHGSLVSIGQQFVREGENDNRRRMAWNAHAHIYTINS